MGWMRLVAALAGLLVSMAATATPAARPQVRVDAGMLAGTAESAALVFRGIPYAASPDGALRWKPPQTAKPWPGVRDASQFGAACPQPSDRPDFWAQVGPTSEDCLFLNVWRPKRSGKYPVMVFIHGGAFTYGSADIPVYDGRRLAERGAVIVTFNYRLGRLGFFAHPALTRENPEGLLGNFGFMDQIAALQWVRRNISRFGGDADNVTLFGESAGAGGVQVLLGSPVSDGLFHKAITQSGAGLAVLAPIRGGPVSAEALGQAWTDGLGLKDATAERLRAIPLADVVKGGNSFPFIDGKVVGRSPGERLHIGAQMRIPLMTGSNSNEGSLFSNATEPAKAALGDAYPQILADYSRRPGSTAEGAALDLVEDMVFVLPSLALAEWQAKITPNVYGYYFEQVPAGDRAVSLGAPHAGELQYLFGNQLADARWDAEDARVSKLLGDYWVRFARTGNPNGGGAPYWPALGKQPSDYLVIGAKTRATQLTPAEKRVQAIAVKDALKGWAAAN